MSMDIFVICELTSLLPLALLPAPIIYGAIIDSSCLWWKTVCGKNLNCLVYNNRNFIFRFQGTTFLCSRISLHIIMYCILFINTPLASLVLGDL